jgi:hypothetical protein
VVAWSEEGAGRVSADLPPTRHDLPDLVLAATAAVEGRVTFADGAPVADVEVSGGNVDLDPRDLEADCLLAAWTHGRTRSRADGTFRLLLPREGACRVAADDAGVEARGRSGDRDLRLVISAHRVRVRVVDARGEAVAGLSYSSITWAPERAGRLDDLLKGRHDLSRARAAADEFEAGVLGRGQDVFLAPGSAWLFVASGDDLLPLER